ncbi:MAG: hypothetical protein KJZ96_14605 [Rhodocyclaceae bacterium]|nr:hypothetical protein [Rhodocyclaceae bacterium]
MMKGIHPVTVCVALLTLGTVALAVSGVGPWEAAWTVLAWTVGVVVALVAIIMIFAGSYRGEFWQAFIGAMRDDFGIVVELWRAMTKSK